MTPVPHGAFWRLVRVYRGAAAVGICSSLIPASNACCKDKLVKVNGKLYRILYLLTNAEATDVFHLSRAKWGERKGNGLGVWNALKK